MAQAIHWFDFDKFYAEVRRTGKQHAVLCITGYGLISIDESIDPIVKDFYENRVGPYWDEERRYIDERYATIPFHFDEIHAPEFTTSGRPLNISSGKTGMIRLHRLKTNWNAIEVRNQKKW